MKKAQAKIIRKSLIYTCAGITAWLLVQELPAMVRYYKMKRL
ncbi:hypothetical protein [Geomonas sp.]|nr:hypothetical protein [Geomonas sp.]HJV37193.1 hypothetical protein [Geomonas sp.]